MEGEIVYMKTSIRMMTILKMGIRRILLCPITPFKIFEEIGISPDPIGPVMILSLVIVLHVLVRPMAYSKLAILLIDGNFSTTLEIKRIDNTLLLNSVNRSISPLDLVGVQSYIDAYAPPLSKYSLYYVISFIILWTIMYSLSLILAKLLGGYPTPLGVATMYTQIVRVISEALALVPILSLSYGVKDVVVVLPKGVKGMSLDILIKYVLSRAIELKEPMISQCISAIGLFLTLWNIVILIAMFSSSTRMELKYSIISAIACYFLTILIHGPVMSVITHL